MNSNIPVGYNEDGEYVGYGYMPEKEQRFVKVPRQGIKGEIKKLIKSKEVKLIEPKEVARLYKKS
jgi:hypothetical protein